MELARGEQEITGETGELKEEKVETMDNSKVDLSTLSEAELEEMLKSQEDDNDRKRKELEKARKKELIARIIAAQKEGKDLDDKLREARAKITDNR